jgi:hypothetical protein
VRKRLPTHQALPCASRENSLIRNLRDRNRLPGTSFLLLLVRTRFTATDRSWRRLIRSIECGWLNLVGQPPTGRRGAAAYWSAWRTLPIEFPRKDQSRVPAHWRVFGTRVSPLTGSPRLAVNPPNAILNYLYSLLESEARLAAAALGLDPGLGVLHVDTKSRDSLACDLMEPVRPQVDAFLLDWIMKEPLKRGWLFEQSDGNCRLMAPFAARLSETAPMWGRAVAPFAEWVTRALWSSSAKLVRESAPPTRLTQRTKREVKGAPNMPLPIRAPRRENLCRGCGKTIQDGRANCAACAVVDATKNMLDAARIGRATGNGLEARKKHAITARRNALAQHAWKSSDQPAWLTDKVYSEKVQPVLAAMSASAIARQISVSRCYAGRIREGYRPHARHWEALAKLVGGLNSDDLAAFSNRADGEQICKK